MILYWNIITLGVDSQQWHSSPSEELRKLCKTLIYTPLPCEPVSLGLDSIGEPLSLMPWDPGGGCGHTYQNRVHAYS